jgi:hypothetical protein
MSEILMTPELFDTHAKDRHSWTENKSLFCSHNNLFIFREYLIHRINIGHRVWLDNEELVTESDIIARGLETLGLKICDTDITGLDSCTDITIREIHKKKLSD